MCYMNFSALISPSQDNKSCHLIHVFNMYLKLWNSIQLRNGFKDSTNFFTRWWFQISNIFYFHPCSGKIPILTNIFQMGWNHQPVYHF